MCLHVCECVYACMSVFVSIFFFFFQLVYTKFKVVWMCCWTKQQRDGGESKNNFTQSKTITNMKTQKRTNTEILRSRFRIFRNPRQFLGIVGSACCCCCCVCFFLDLKKVRWCVLLLFCVFLSSSSSSLTTTTTSCLAR